MLVVRVLGGVGNQLFQYAFYEFLKLNNEEVYLDISSYKIQKYHYGYELDKLFDLDYQDYQGTQFAHCDRNRFGYRAIRKFLGITLSRESDYYENNKAALVRNRKIPGDVYFDGFWQDVHYVQQVDDLREKLKFREFDLNEKNRKLVEFICSQTTVSVHVRRGDYLKHQELFGCCDESYYAAAIDYIQKEIKPDAFVFFSDDINWCREKYSSMPQVRFVDWNTGEESYLDMYLMSLCSHNIIANSTFSWWGAYLNKNRHKRVVLPAKWSNNMDENHFACEDWIKL